MARVYELPTGTAIDLDQLFAVGPVAGHEYWDIQFTMTFLAWTGPIRNPQDYTVRFDTGLVFRDRTDWWIEGEEDRVRSSRLLPIAREYAERVRSELVAAWGREA